MIKFERNLDAHAPMSSNHRHGFFLFFGHFGGGEGRSLGSLTPRSRTRNPLELRVQTN